MKRSSFSFPVTSRRSLALVASALALLVPLAAPAQSESTSPVITNETIERVLDEAPVVTVGSAADSLRRDMRKLWTEHVVWTRAYVVSALADLPDQKAAAARLMRNQEDIGNAVGQYYSKSAGAKLTVLLKEHISIAVDLVAAAKAGDEGAKARADREWRRNADDIAVFLSDANPNWPRATLADMMIMHLDTTANELGARLERRWDDDVRAYDAVYAHILEMSDILAEGIVKQFPDRFTVTLRSSAR